MKDRLGVLVMHDKDGLADEYVLYLLREIRSVSSYVIVVCNGEMQEHAVHEIKDFADDVFIRPDSGFDAAAFKEVFERLYGWEQIRSYEELMLVNDSFYGPFVPLEEIFRSMEAEKADFWGLTAQPETACPVEIYGMEKMPYHIQPYFLVIRRRLLNSDVFQKFWETIKISNNYLDIVIQYELRMTQYLTDRGFVGKTYVKEQFVSEADGGDDLILIYEYIERLLHEGNMPVVKKKSFTQPQDSGLLCSLNQNVDEIIQFIKNNTAYDVGMIWKNLIRNCDPVSLKENLHLEYVLPDKAADRDGKKKGHTAVIAHLYYEDLLEECINYLKNVPAGYNIFITVQNPETAALVERLCRGKGICAQIRQVKARGRDVSALLDGCREVCMNYDYLCFVHDKKTSGNDGAAKIGMSYRYLMWENMLKSSCYIENIVDLLEKEAYLGVLAPPSPYHGEYINNFGDEWTNCYAGVKALTEKMGLNCIMDSHNPPFTLSTAFWCKTKALRRLFDFGFTCEDFPMEPLPPDGSLGHFIERILAYVAQHEGYASGIVMNEEYANLQLSNYSYMMNSLLTGRHQSGYFGTYYGLMHQDQYFDYIDLEGLLPFCKGEKKLYIYGSGGMAGKIVSFLTVNHIFYDGFIVTDGYRTQDSMFGKKIYELGEMEKDIRIILGLNEQNSSEAAAALRNLGFSSHDIYQIRKKK